MTLVQAPLGISMLKSKRTENLAKANRRRHNVLANAFFQDNEVNYDETHSYIKALLVNLIDQNDKNNG